MTKTLITAAISGGVSVAGGTFFAPCANSGLQLKSTEPQAQVPFKNAGALSNFTIRVTARSASGLVNGRVRLNGANTTLLITVPTSTTGYFRDTDSVSVAADDLVNFSVAGTSGGTATFVAMNVLFDATGTTMQRFAGVGFPNIWNSLTWYAALADHNNDANEVAEARNQFRIPTTGTIKNLAVYLSVNSRGGVIAYLRKNGSNTALTIDTPDLTTGLFQDTSNEISVVKGDLVNYSVIGGNTPGGLDTITLDFISCEWYNTDNKFLSINSAFPGVAWSGTYIAFGGGGSSGSSTESNVQIDPENAVQVSKLWAYIEASGDYNGFLRLRVNSAASQLSIPIYSGVTGELADDIDTVTLASSDDINYERDTNADLNTFGCMLSNAQPTVSILGKTHILGKTLIK